MPSLKYIDLEDLARALSEEFKHTDDPDVALQNAFDKAQGEPSGFSGPAGRTDEVQFTMDGRPVLLMHQGRNFPKSTPETTRKGRGGLYDTNFQPSIPDVPNMDQITNLRRRPWEKRPTEGSFLKRVSQKYQVSARNLFFKDVIATVKSIFPEIKMVFPQPPTYIWNPKDENEKLDINGIKNKLKIRFPELEWTNREIDGVPLATMVFVDQSSAEFLIGEDANHLTIAYQSE